MAVIQRSRCSCGGGGRGILYDDVTEWHQPSIRLRVIFSTAKDVRDGYCGCYEVEGRTFLYLQCLILCQGAERTIKRLFVFKIRDIVSNNKRFHDARSILVLTMPTMPCNHDRLPTQKTKRRRKRREPRHDPAGGSSPTSGVADRVRYLEIPRAFR